MLKLTERAARDDLSLHAGETSKGPLLIAGWSLGALLALRLAEKAGADGLLLLAGTARFTRPKEQKDRGWPDTHVRQMIKSLMKDRQEAETKFRQSVFTEAEWEAGLGASLPPAGSWTTPALIAGLQILRSEDCLSLLPEMECPALLIHGTEDNICPYRRCGRAGVAFAACGAVIINRLRSRTVCRKGSVHSRSVEEMVA